MNGRILTFIILLAFTVRVSANRLPEAEALYEKGDYTAALEIYKSIEKEYGTSGALMFNIGQCYVKAGNLGEGMVAYQRALRLNAGDKETLANIKYVDSRVQEANKAEMKGKKLSVIPESSSFFSSMRNWICNNHSSNTWAWWAAGFFILVIICIAMYIFRGEVLLRKIGFFGGISSLALTVIFITFSFMTADSESNHDRGVVTAYKVELKAEPGDKEHKVAMPLTQGTVLDILETSTDKNDSGEWYKVRLNSDYIGWIKGSDFEVI